MGSEIYYCDCLFKIATHPILTGLFASFKIKPPLLKPDRGFSNNACTPDYFNFNASFAGN
jgi:hypothetical protein